MEFFGRRGSTSSDDDKLDSPEVPDTPSSGDAPDEQPKDNAPPPNRTFDTALGAGSVIEGKLSSDGNIRLDGQFKGTLEIGGNVLVGITAEVEADAVGTNVTVAGVVRGNVRGKKVHLLATARVWGDITAESLITEDGAFIEGHISMEQMRNGELSPPNPTPRHNGEA